jgi:hypothetical protein
MCSQSYINVLSERNDAMLQVENLESRNAPSISFANGVLTINAHDGQETIYVYPSDNPNPEYYDRTYFEEHAGLHTSYGGQLLQRLVVDKDEINRIVVDTYGKHDYVVNHTGLKVTINTGTHVYVVGQGTFDVNGGSVRKM